MSLAARLLLAPTRRAKLPVLRRSFASTLARPSFHFDTQAFIERLEREGLSRQQATGVMGALAEVNRDAHSSQPTSDTSSLTQDPLPCFPRSGHRRERHQHERRYGLSLRAGEGPSSLRPLLTVVAVVSDRERFALLAVLQQSYAQSVDFTTLKSELQLLESQDFALMRTENERLLSEVEKLKQSLKEQIVRTQAGVRLDLNLEKGRIRDEASLHELKIKEVDTRIESEIAGLRTQIQGAKVRSFWSLFSCFPSMEGDKADSQLSPQPQFSILQYMVTVATGGGALLLAYSTSSAHFHPRLSPRP